MSDVSLRIHKFRDFFGWLRAIRKRPIFQLRAHPAVEVDILYSKKYVTIVYFIDRAESEYGWRHFEPSRPVADFGKEDSVCCFAVRS